jgi:DNA-binding response OmpR family regulator
MEQTPLHGQRGTVLLVEQDVLVRMPVADYLRECGFKVLEAATTEEAVQALEDHRFGITVVMSSIALAGDGFGISKWVKQHRPELNVILTGTPKRAVDAAAKLCGDDTLPTRLAPQLLLRRIRQLLSKRRDGQRKGRTAISPAGNL